MDIKVGDSYYHSIFFGVTVAKPVLKWVVFRQRQRGNNTTQEREFIDASPLLDLVQV